MIRVLIFAFIAFLLPFLFYAIANTYFAKAKTPEDSIWTDAPYPLLGIIGSLLAVSSVIGLVLWSEGKL